MDPMEIFYNVRIRCFKVKDIEKVNLTVISENDKDWHLSLKEHRATLKDNIDTDLALFEFEPQLKKDFVIKYIPVPPGTDVVEFDNNCGNRFGRPNQMYDVSFFTWDKKVIMKQETSASSERNFFTIVVPPASYEMQYGIVHGSGGGVGGVGVGVGGGVNAVFHRHYHFKLKRVTLKSKKKRQNEDLIKIPKKCRL
jgi:hypothetical protein